jgi:hypothetical protein
MGVQRKEITVSEATRATWNLGFTHNLGNFQSIRIDCSVSDSQRGDESVKELSDRVYAFVEKELVIKVKEAKAELEDI